MSRYWTMMRARAANKREHLATWLALKMLAGVSVEVVGPPEEVAAVKARANEILGLCTSALSIENKERSDEER